MPYERIVLQMHIDPATVERRVFYRILTGCIVPRPIAWVSTQDSAGQVNLAPFSFFNGVASNPPSLSVCVSHNSRRATGQKDTLSNMLDTGEFVVNVVDEATAAAMVKTSSDVPPEVNEFEIAGLTPIPSMVVRPPRVGESPASFECVVYTTVQVGEGSGSSTLVVGVIQHMHIRDDVADEQGYIDTLRLKPVGRLAGNDYCLVHETFELKNT